MINKYFDGNIPTYNGSHSTFDQQLLEVNKATVKKYEEAMEKMEFSVALSSIWELISRSNKYIDETTPWTLAKEDAKREELANVRKVDELGRVVIPIELRRTLGIAEKDALEIYVDDEKIILKKYKPSMTCHITGEVSDSNVQLAGGKLVLSREGAEILLQEIQNAFENAK